METIPSSLPRGEDGYVKWDVVDVSNVDLPAGDDMGIPSDDEEINVEEVKMDSGFGSVIVVDNLPKVPSAKVEKLTTVLKKIFGQIGVIHENGLHMPTDTDGSTKGFAFIEFGNAQEAAAAREQTDGYKLDKAHIFKVSRFDDFAKYEAVPDTYKTPEPKPYVARENTQSYMLDERGRDQYAIRFGDATEIHWNDAQKNEPVEVYKRDFWTESYVQWSPRGNFLATVHRQGVALWGGPGFARFQKFSHNGVQFIEFSPCERYLASGSTHEETREATVVVNFFDTRTGAKLRTFQGPISEFATGGGGLTWPVFKWAGPSEDGAFFARMGKNQVSVYGAPDMSLVDKKSIKLDGVRDFCWSPADPILSVYQPEQGGGNQPARVALIELPSKREIRSKNLFSVSDVRMFWQQSGDYFAVKVDRHTKTKKSTYSGFELFRVKEPDCPMEVLELPDKNQKIVAFAWEPKGHRFAVIHGDGARPDVSFYTMIDKESKVNKVKLIGTIKNKTANHLFWSPQGKTIVLAGLKTMNGQFEFFNVDEMETMASCEHFMATDVEWDPTGRYVTTAVTSVHQMENGFHVWTFNGKLLYKHARERFYQFLWRPRAPSLLSKEKEEEIVKNLKKYSKRFDELDESIRGQQDSHLAAQKQEVLDAWNKWIEAKKAEVEAPEYQAKVAELMRARYPGWKPGGDADVVEEQVEVEEIISVEEEPYAA
jgi:translation initiation factor 3 subunit B